MQVLCTVPWYGVQCCHLEELIHLTFNFSLLVSFSSGSGLINGLPLEQFYFWLLVVLEGLTLALLEFIFVQYSMGITSTVWCLLCFLWIDLEDVLFGSLNAVAA